MSPRRVVYTVLVGGYETLLEQHIAKDHDVDLVCFTDDPTVTSPSWQIRPITPAFENDPNRSSRQPKILPHEYLADYDESLYIDNTVLLTVDPTTIFDTLLPDDRPMALLRHSFREKLSVEFDAVVLAGREAAWVADEQQLHYRTSHPEVLDGDVFWGGFLLRRHNDPAVVRAMGIWWQHVLRYSRRDQLSLPVALKLGEVPVQVHEIDNHVSPFHEWPRSAAQRVDSGGAPLPEGPERLIADLRAETSAAAVEIAAAAAREQALNDQVGALAEQVRALNTHATDLMDHLTQARERIAALESSTSWRVTRPLRAATEQVRARRAATQSDG